MVKGCLQTVITTVGNLADVNSGPVYLGGVVHRIHGKTKGHFEVFNTHRPLSEGSIICSRSKAKKFLPSLLW